MTTAVLSETSERRLLVDEVVRLQGYERVASSQLDDTFEIFVSGKVAAPQACAHATDLEAVEVADQLVNHFGWGVRVRPDTVEQQLPQHVFAIAVGLLRRH